MTNHVQTFQANLSKMTEAITTGYDDVEEVEQSLGPPPSPFEILKINLYAIELAIVCAIPQTLDLFHEDASESLVSSMKVVAVLVRDLVVPQGVPLAFCDHIVALYRVIEPFATLESYTNDIAGIALEAAMILLEKANLELATVM